MKATRILSSGVIAVAAMAVGIPAASAGTGYYKAYKEVSDVTLQQFPLGFAQYYDQKLDQPWGLVTDTNPCYVYHALPCKTNAPAPAVYPELSSNDKIANDEQADGLQTLWVVNNLSSSVVNYYDTGLPVMSGSGQISINVPGRPTGIALNTYCQARRVPNWSLVAYGSACDTTVPLTGSVPFAVTGNGVKAGAVWLTATREGKVYGWNPAVDPNQAFLVIDDSARGSDYTGITMSPDGSFILLADFKRGQIVAYDSNYQRVLFRNAAGALEPLHDSSIPFGFGPSNVQFISYPPTAGGDGTYEPGTYPASPTGVHLYVTYGLKSTPGANTPEQVGPAAPTTTYAGDYGHVSEYTFNTDGTYQTRQLSIPSDRMNAPWSVVLAPVSFGVDASSATSYDLWIGNFGDGYLNVVDAASGQYMVRAGEAPNPIVPPSNTVPGYPTVGTTPVVPTGTPIFEPGVRGLAFKKVLYQTSSVPLLQEWAPRLFYVCNLNFQSSDPAWEWSVLGFIRPG